MGAPIETRISRHRRACQGFADVVRAVPAGRWAGPTPCSEWDAAALVEHVIGFHEFLLLPLLAVGGGAPAGRPPTPPASWRGGRAVLGHLGVNVPDLPVTRAYYDRFLPILGFEPYLADEHQLAYRPVGGKPGTYLFFYEAAE